MNGMIIIGIIIAIVVDILAAYEFYKIAKEKGYDDQKYLVYSLLFGLIGYLMVIALPDRSNNHAEDNQNELPEI